MLFITDTFESIISNSNEDFEKAIVLSTISHSYVRNMQIISCQQKGFWCITN